MSAREIERVSGKEQAEAKLKCITHTPHVPSWEIKIKGKRNTQTTAEVGWNGAWRWVKCNIGLFLQHVQKGRNFGTLLAKCK